MSLYRKKRVVVITTAKRSFFRWKLHIISLFSIEEEKPTLFSLSYLVSFNVDPKLIFFYSIHWWTVNLEFPLFPLPDQTSYSPPRSWLVLDRTVALHPKAAVPLKIRLFSLCIQLFLDRFSAGIVCIEKGHWNPHLRDKSWWHFSVNKNMMVYDLSYIHKHIHMVLENNFEF